MNSFFCIDKNTFPNGILQVFYLFYLKLLNAAYMLKIMNILILYYQKLNVASEKVSVRNIICYD